MRIKLEDKCMKDTDSLRMTSGPSTALLTLTLSRHDNTMAVGTAEVHAEPSKCEKGLALTAIAYHKLGDFFPGLPMAIESLLGGFFLRGRWLQSLLLRYD